MDLEKKTLGVILGGCILSFLTQNDYPALISMALYDSCYVNNFTYFCNNLKKSKK